MASLRKFGGSPYFFACFSDALGRRVQRSTKQSHRKKAQALADLWAKAAKLGSQKRLSEAQSRRILSEIYESVNDEPLESATTGDFLRSWVEKRKTDTSPRTQQAYAQVARDFLVSLGDRSTRDISTLTKVDVAKYRDAVLMRTSKATANKSLKYLRVALGAAYKDGLTQVNPAAQLAVFKRSEQEQSARRAFTLAEIRLLLAHASGEWRGLILVGVYTGQRLGDVACLSWHNVNLHEKEVRFVTQKTGRQMILPLAAPLLAYLESLPSTDNPGALLFPKSAPLVSGKTGESRLSQQFHSIMVAAGLADERSRVATGKGRAIQRRVSQISFHSLRHTATSLLKNAGVSEIVAMDIIGHDSKAMSRHYTRVDDSLKRTALGTLPDVTIN